MFRKKAASFAAAALISAACSVASATEMTQVAITYIIDHPAIDAARMGIGFPMGPLTLSDLIGLDVVKEVCDVMYEATKEPSSAPPAAAARRSRFPRSVSTTCRSPPFAHPDRPLARPRLRISLGKSPNHTRPHLVALTWGPRALSHGPMTDLAIVDAAATPLQARVGTKFAYSTTGVREALLSFAVSNAHDILEEEILIHAGGREVQAVEDGFMTKDLALLVGPDQKWLSTMGYLEKVDEYLNKALAG